MARRGWDSYDFLLITGDAYVDHPSFGPAIIGRVLEAEGYRVAVLAQPDWRQPEAFSALGRPRLGVLISGGNIDSMVAHYTAAKKRRHDDAYSPGEQAGPAPGPGHHRLRQPGAGGASGTSRIVIGGLEASLRRFAHYDYWEDKVRRSILFDAQADLLRLRHGGDAPPGRSPPVWPAGTPVGRSPTCGAPALPADDPGACAYPKVEVPSFEAVCADKTGLRPGQP